MKRGWITQAVVTTVALLALGTSGETPLACRMDALNATQRARHGELMKKLRASVVGQRELRDGYVFQLGPDAKAFTVAAEWITLERRCCPFLIFGLEWKEETGAALRLTGRQGVKQFLKAEIGLQ